ncbi:MAG: hypothetical protein OXJ37_04775 [Bryobacterales bacterium]|nr:hypothetical protein [Bryobacterales bacterium]
MPQRLTQENWLQWRAMGGKTLMGVSQMVWQSPDEMTANRELFAKVAGETPLDDFYWRDAITWNAAVLLSLSVEQTLKAIAIRVNGGCLKTHDLKLLWNDIRSEDREGIAAKARLIRKRTEGTRLATGACADGVEEWTEVIEHHKDTFENARYNLESQRQGYGLSRNLELWVLALAVSEHAWTLR